MNRTPNRPGAAPSPGTTPPSQRDDKRDDKRAIRIALVTALIALVAVVVFNLRAPKDRLSAPGEGAPAAIQGAPGMAGPSVDAPQPSAPSAATRLPPRVAKAWAHLPGARPRRSRRCGHAHCRTTDRLRPLGQRKPHATERVLDPT